MTISLSARQRERFRADLLAHRETFSLNDAEYADQVLKVSLNTYKKCVQSTGNAPLALKRHTFVSIFANTALDPKNYGLSIGVPSQVSPFGGYQKNEFQLPLRPLFSLPALVPHGPPHHAQHPRNPPEREPGVPIIQRVALLHRRGRRARRNPLPRRCLYEPGAQHSEPAGVSLKGR